MHTEDKFALKSFVGLALAAAIALPTTIKMGHDFDNAALPQWDTLVANKQTRTCNDYVFAQQADVGFVSRALPDDKGLSKPHVWRLNFMNNRTLFEDLKREQCDGVAKPRRFSPLHI